MNQFSRIVRIKDGSAATYADLGEGRDVSKATIIQGNPFSSARVATLSDRIVHVDQSKLLCPVDPEDVHTIRCIGANYKAHARESDSKMLPFPPLFYKPLTALGGPNEKLMIPKIAQIGPELDYEAELVIVIGKQGRNIPEEEALSHVFGYTIGNDVSQRKWQTELGGGPCIGKMYDGEINKDLYKESAYFIGWAPLGHCIISANTFGDPQNLRITTHVNGEIRQDGNTKDMIHSIRHMVSWLSQGSTLLPGDLIFTGSPEGTAVGMNPPKWLRDGDVVEIVLQNLAVCRSVVTMEN